MDLSGGLLLAAAGLGSGAGWEWQLGVRCGAAAVWMRWVGRLFGAAEPETESRGRGAGKVRDVAAVRGRAPTAVVRGHGSAVHAPDLVPGSRLWDPRAPLVLAGLERILQLTSHTLRFFGLCSQIWSAKFASPFLILTPGYTNHGHHLPHKASSLLVAYLPCPLFFQISPFCPPVPLFLWKLSCFCKAVGPRTTECGIKGPAPPLPWKLC